MNWVKKLREKLNGWKSVLTAVAGMLTATAAWAASELTGAQFVVALFAGIEMIFLRFGIAKSGNGTH